MHELALAGLVRWERERIRRVLKDRLTGHMRMRCVSGRTKYTVFKSPHKDWFSDTADDKLPHKYWPASKVTISKPLESRNTPNKTEGQNQKSPLKQRPASKVKSLYRTRIIPASLSVLHQEGGVGVSESVLASNVGSAVGAGSDPAVKSDNGNDEREREKSSSSVSGIHRESKSDDDDSLSNPKRVIRETPELRIQRFKESALSKIKSKYGNLFNDTEIRESLDDFEVRARSAESSPNSDNYFVTCFENELSEAVPDASPVAPSSDNATHDDLLKDTVNYGKLQWGGRYIVVQIGGDRREIISRDTAQAMTGSTAEHMVEHLRAKGFWAEVYARAEDVLKDSTETKSKPLCEKVKIKCNDGWPSTFR